jgi:hypothetical protein
VRPSSLECHSNCFARSWTEWRDEGADKRLGFIAAPRLICSATSTYASSSTVPDSNTIPATEIAPRGLKPLRIWFLSVLVLQPKQLDEFVTLKRFHFEFRQIISISLLD